MVRVLIVDDSAVMRAMLREVLEAHDEIEVIGVAPDPLLAESKIRRLRPDVLTLDVEMPKMDGITFLRKLMRYQPMPVVMVSSLTAEGADVTLEALRLGAVDFIHKPQGSAGDVSSVAEGIRRKVIAAAQARVRRLQEGRDGKPSIDTPRRMAKSAGGAVGGGAREPIANGRRGSVPPAAVVLNKCVCIGASTGGTVALEYILRSLPAKTPPIAIVQHMPARFTNAFANRVNGLSAVTVVEATDGLELRMGLAAVAPGDRHIVVERRGGRVLLRLLDTPPVNRHKPAVDVLFHSAAEVLKTDALGVLLTGMGADGAVGLGEMKSAGAITVAQDEASCVVFGMPRAAIERGAARAVLSLEQIATFLAGPSA